MFCYHTLFNMRFAFVRLFCIYVNVFNTFYFSNYFVFFLCFEYEIQLCFTSMYAIKGLIFQWLFIFSMALNNSQTSVVSVTLVLTY